MKIEKYEPYEVKIQYNKFIIKKIGGRNEWRTNILTNVLYSKYRILYKASVKILKLGEKRQGFHFMSGFHSISHFSTKGNSIYEQNVLYVRSNQKGMFYLNFSFFFFF